jgi:hypothetical protein
MNLAGKYLSIAQSTAESALLAPLRAKHKLNLNLIDIANQAKEELQELGIPLNPTNLLNRADDIAGRIGTYYDDTVGLEQQRWNPITKNYEEYIVTDQRKDFRR